MKRLGLFAALVLNASLPAFRGSVPSGYPAYFLMGHVYEVHDATAPCDGAGEIDTVSWMVSTRSGLGEWDATYRYLVGGLAFDNEGWYAAWPGSGAMINNFCNVANGSAMMPTFIYEQMYSYDAAYGGDGGNWFGNISNALNNATWMGRYYQDWIRLLQFVNTWLAANPTKTVTIDVEPDVWGYIQQQSASAPKWNHAVRVASATNPGAPYSSLAAFPNTMQGFARALLYLRDVYVASPGRCVLALHVSSWAAAPNPATEQGAVNVLTHASAVGQFVNACNASPTARPWDLMFLDPSDADADLYALNGLDIAGTTHWWDKANVTQPTYNRYADWVDALSNSTNLRAMLWQVPIGNSTYRTMSNTNGHWRDNKVEYFLNAADGATHVCEYAAKGVVGILWGRGSLVSGNLNGTGSLNYWYNSWATEYCGGTQDGVTNPWAGGALAATVADDDGGYLRNNIRNYYLSKCFFTAPGTPTYTATPSATPSRTATPSPTRSGTASPTRTATSSATPTRTASASPSATRTPTRSATTTPTSTATGTASRTATATPTQTPLLTATSTFTRTPTPSASPSRTSTVTATPSATGTPTQTLNVTPTFSASSSPSRTPTNTATPASTSTSTGTPTASRTVTPGSSPTFTPTFTPSRTATLSGTPTATRTPTSTSTAPFTGTSTGTVTPGSSPTFTQTATSTRTATVSATPSSSSTAAPTGTASSTGTSSRTNTPGSSPSFTSTATRTATASATPSSSSTAAASATPSATEASSPTPSPTATSTPSPGMSPFFAVIVSSLDVVSGPTAGGTTVTITGGFFTAGAGIASVSFGGKMVRSFTVVNDTTLVAVTDSHEAGRVDVIVVPLSSAGAAGTLPQAFEYRDPQDANGDLEVKDAVALPNPATGGSVHVMAYLRGPADELWLTVYSEAMVKVRRGGSPGEYQAGWNRCVLDTSGLSNGMWYVVVEAGRKGSLSRHRIVKLVIMR